MVTLTQYIAAVESVANRTHIHSQLHVTTGLYDLVVLSFTNHIILNGHIKIVSGNLSLQNPVKNIIMMKSSGKQLITKIERKANKCNNVLSSVWFILYNYCNVNNFQWQHSNATLWTIWLALISCCPTIWYTVSISYCLVALSSSPNTGQQTILKCTHVNHTVYTNLLILQLLLKLFMNS